MFRLLSPWRKGVQWSVQFNALGCVHTLYARVRLRPFAIFRRWRIRPIGWVLVQHMYPEPKYLEWRPEDRYETGETKHWL